MDNQSNMSENIKIAGSSKKSSVQKLKKEIKNQIFAVFFALLKDDEVSIVVSYLLIILEVLQVFVFPFQKEVSI